MHLVKPSIIGNLRGGRRERVGDYTSLDRPYWVLISGKTPYPGPPTPLRVPIIQPVLEPQTPPP